MADTLQKVKNISKKLKTNRKKLVARLREIANELNKMENDVRISKVSGSVAGAVGSGLIIGGFAASFFTFGASLIVSAVGAGIGGAGAVTGAGASIARYAVTKNRRKEVAELLEKDDDLLEDLKSNIKIAFETGKLTWGASSAIYKMVQNAVSFVDDAADIGKAAVTGIIKGASKGLAIAGVVFTAITLPVDIYTVVSNSIEIHKGQEHEFAVKLNGLADDIEKSYELCDTLAGL
ncbi:hypothetical protein SNE40_016114 [Patella caerulea]|uniref:Uncharacterized protein n=1 Tax=Patella caerulea TaxID=87958 RepID=A0AAN8JDG1_PATCE